MKLDNQLFVRESNSKICRICNNVSDVAKFLDDLYSYVMTPIEYQAVDTLMSKLLPLPKVNEQDNRRYLIIANEKGELLEWQEDDSLPIGSYKCGIVYRGAFSNRSCPVAQFYIGNDDFPITITLSRKSSTESLPYSLLEEIWAQKIVSLDDPEIPDVKADLVPFDQSLLPYVKSTLGAKFTLKIGEDRYSIDDKNDFMAIVQELVGHKASHKLESFVDDVFHHLDTFPKCKVSSPVVSYYTDRNKAIYAAGDGTNNTRKLLYAGKFFPSYFTGLPGNAVLFRIGVFENEKINILLSRN